ncbi:hypothetical protein [Pseudoxanthomonas kalamensis]|uniref:hypothetical protein n=1 Tax=Pseudoxanthomonas kalamensis TaxID=289483 RepID=UPI0013909F75|nr:hypothetical protein [Pseudoxanthomonas kalamensis]
MLSRDNASCSAFLTLGTTDGVDETGSIIVFNHPPKEALPSVPSNFFMNAAGVISHRTPESVPDDKNFYYVDGIKPLDNEKLSTQDNSSTEVFKYQRTVTRIDLSGEESSDTQVCVDIVRYSDKATALFTGCVNQSNGASLHDRALGFMCTARVRD